MLVVSGNEFIYDSTYVKERRECLSKPQVQINKDNGYSVTNLKQLFCDMISGINPNCSIGLCYEARNLENRNTIDLNKLVKGKHRGANER